MISRALAVFPQTAKVVTCIDSLHAFGASTAGTNCGMLLSFRLQADYFESEAKSIGIIGKPAPGDHRGTDELGFPDELEPVNNLTLRDPHEEPGVKQRFRLPRAGTIGASPMGNAAGLCLASEIGILSRVRTARPGRWLVFYNYYRTGRKCCRFIPASTIQLELNPARAGIWRA